MPLLFKRELVYDRREKPMNCVWITETNVQAIYLLLDSMRRFFMAYDEACRLPSDCVDLQEKKERLIGHFPTAFRRPTFHSLARMR